MEPPLGTCIKTPGEKRRRHPANHPDAVVRASAAPVIAASAGSSFRVLPVPKRKRSLTVTRQRRGVVLLSDRRLYERRETLAVRVLFPRGSPSGTTRRQ